MNIIIKNAYEKNLKNIDLEIPRNELTVITIRFRKNNITQRYHI